jgi:hypothetical protein
MPTLLDTQIAQVLILSFFGTLALTGLVCLVGRKNSGFFMASASVGIIYAWFCGFILGTPDFPPEFNNTAILSATACLLVIGAILDFILIKRKKFPQPMVITIILISGVIITVWMRSGIDVWSLPILLGWSTVAISLHRISINKIFGSGNSTFLLVTASLGTGIIAWISDIVVDRDLAFGLCAISIGFFVCNFLKPRLYFGYSILLAGGGSLYILALRLVEQMPTLIPAFIILAFIFFVDVSSQYAQKNLKLILPIPNSISVFILTLFPLSLATIIALIANEFPVS